MCGYRNKDRTSAPVFRNQFILRQLLFYTLNICAGFIYFINSYNNLNTCSLCVIDSLYGLRHYAVIGCNYEDCDIGRIGAAHTHCRERLMSRSIQKRNFLSVHFNHISADMLRNSAGFPVNHICVADSIQQRSFSVIDVAHNTDDRRTFYHQAFVLFLLFQKFFNYVHNLFFFTEHIKLHSDLFRRIIVDLLIYCYNFALHKKFFNNHGRNNLHLIGQLFNRENFRDYDLFDLLLLFLRLFRLRLLHLCYLFLFSAFLCLSFKRFISVFFFLIVSFFVLCLISLALLLFYDRCCKRLSVISAGISAPVCPRSLSARTLISAASFRTRSSSVTGRTSFAKRALSLTFSSFRTILSSVRILAVLTGRTVSLRSSTRRAMLTGRAAFPCRISGRLCRTYRTVFSGRTAFSRGTYRTVLGRSLCRTRRTFSPLRTYRAFRFFRTGGLRRTRRAFGSLRACLPGISRRSGSSLSRALAPLILAVSLNSAAVSGVLRTDYVSQVFLLVSSVRFFRCSGSRVSLCFSLFSFRPAGSLPADFTCHIFLQCTHMIFNINIFLLEKV